MESDHPASPRALPDLVAEILTQTSGLPGALMPTLHLLQDRLGHIPSEAVPLIAQALNLSRAEVQGVISFYHDFRTRPPGRHVVKICQAEACQSMGSEALTRHALTRTAAPLKGTSADGEFTVEPVYCLGNCACSPAMMLDGSLHGRVTPQLFDELVASLPER